MYCVGSSQLKHKLKIKQASKFGLKQMFKYYIQWYYMLMNNNGLMNLGNNGAFINFMLSCCSQDSQKHLRVFPFLIQAYSLTKGKLWAFHTCTYLFSLQNYNAYHLQCFGKKYLYIKQCARLIPKEGVLLIEVNPRWLICSSTIIYILLQSPWIP